MVAVLGAGWGPDGMETSTMMRALSELHRRVSDMILLDLRPIHNTKARQIAQAGLSLVPEGRQVFPMMSVRGNILMRAHTRTDFDKGVEVEALLDPFPRLCDRINAPADVLFGGEQKMLALAIADRGYVLENGRVVHSGATANLRLDASIEQAYLGADVAAE